MSKFHINKHGVPAPCKAKKGKCPLGGEEQHFNSREEAQTYADKINEQEHSLLPEVESKTFFGLSESDFKDLSAKVATITLKRENNQPEEKVEGIVRNVNWEDKTLSIRDENDFFGDIREINMDSVSEFEASKNAYYSEEYKKELRENKKAQKRFKYSKEKLSKFEGKFVKVQYDNKEFDGQVIGTLYSHENDSELIIQNQDGEIKHIKNYQMQSIDFTGTTQMEHETQKRLLKIENELLGNYEDFNWGSSMAPETSEVDPDTQLNEYFQARIKKHEGKKVDLDEFDFDWVKEVENNRDAYLDEEEYYNPTMGGRQYEEWSSNSENVFHDDIRVAEETNKFFEGKKEYIESMVEKVQTIDWTEYGMTQKEGEIEALNYLWDSDLLSN